MAEPTPNPAPPAETPEVAGEEAGPSKKALKKAEAKAKKEAEKAKRAAERAAATAQASAAAAEDHATDNYGQETHEIKLSSDAIDISLKTLNDEHLGKKVKLRAFLQNARMQGAKMAFVELRETGNWAIQGVVAANADGSVSRQMVKFIGSVNPESFVVVEATVEKPLEPVKSCRISNYELHLTKLFVISSAPAMLGMTLSTANKAVTNFSDEEAPAEAAVEGVEKLSIAGEVSGPPAASMLTHLDNIVMHKRSYVQQAIADIRVEVKHLFRSYLRDQGFKEFEPPCLIAAASEGGANVFRLPYFEKEAFLAQSPQFYKQIEVLAGRKRVFCVGPVFRAENSNTPRHMTEFTGLDLEMEVTDYREALHMLEGVLLHIFRTIKKTCADEIALVRSVYPSEEFLLPEEGKEVRLTFAEGQKLLREEGPEEFRNVSDFEDMTTPQEKALGALIKKKYNTDFYVQEVLSGGQRIHDPVELEARLRTKGVDPNSPGIREYVDLFRQVGAPPHAGGGIGLDRVVAWYLNLPSVHLAAYYPRTPKRLLP
ncbi:hypothetical protein QBC36DRAFT_285714 [Triangularia setosa]|uniref:aspartate--tRNA ligase n=1 Tax=Triangularia setosa TaxID=2587417 RepID=A0AAN6WHL4_9PEZI|nr:hypothetical protein QBC36DRAFT_285714 [Podospora setosa]